MFTRLRLRLLQLRIILRGLKTIRRDRYAKRYVQIMRKPMNKLTQKDYKDFEKIYTYFDGDIDKI